MANKHKDPGTGKFLPKMTVATLENTGQAKPGPTQVIGSGRKEGPKDAPSAGPGAFAPTAGPLGSNDEKAQQARIDADANLTALFDKTFGEAPAEAAPKAPETPVADSAPAEQPAAVDNASSSEDPRMNRARTALERSGFTSDEIATMTPEDTLSRGLRRADALSNDDDVYRRLNELDKRTQNSEQPADSPAKAEEQPVSLRQKLDGLVDSLGEEGVADVEAVIAPMQAELKELRELAAEIRNDRQKQGMGLMEQRRQDLGDRFPEIKDDQKFGRVASRMSALSKDEAYRPQAGESNADAAGRLMEDAVLSLRFAEVAGMTPEQVASHHETALKKTAGVPTTSAQTSPDPVERELSHEDRTDIGLNALLDGRSPDEARQLAWG